jgi:glycosyltransferase involved in cell wall biosynthesis
MVTTSAWQSFEAEVSVVVPLFNQGRHLADSVQSVISASGEGRPRTELVIVDDHSTDGSHGVAESLLREIDWFPATLLGRAASGGSAVARNVGFAAARAPHVLTLDAGNTLYPTALRTLLERLEPAPSDVIAAYGIVEQFDTTGSLGLSGHLPWDIERLVRGNFISDIAMFRREAWSQIGGYAVPSDVEDGWEEYDLWLSAAELGLRAEFVGSVVGRSRQQPSSMLKVSDVDLASTFVILRERHPRLPWQS